MSKHYRRFAESLAEADTKVTKRDKTRSESAKRETQERRQIRKIKTSPKTEVTHDRISREFRLAVAR